MNQKKIKKIKTTTMTIKLCWTKGWMIKFLAAKPHSNDKTINKHLSRKGYRNISTINFLCKSQEFNNVCQKYKNEWKDILGIYNHQGSIKANENISELLIKVNNWYENIIHSPMIYDSVCGMVFQWRNKMY